MNFNAKWYWEFGDGARILNVFRRILFKLHIPIPRMKSGAESQMFNNDIKSTHNGSFKEWWLKNSDSLDIQIGANVHVLKYLVKEKIKQEKKIKKTSGKRKKK